MTTALQAHKHKLTLKLDIISDRPQITVTDVLRTLHRMYMEQPDALDHTTCTIFTPLGEVSATLLVTTAEPIRGAAREADRSREVLEQLELLRRGIPEQENDG